MTRGRSVASRAENGSYARVEERVHRARRSLLSLLIQSKDAEIVAQMRHVAEWACKLVIPIPEIRIVDPKEIGP